jgi:hypothetical protein
MVSSVALVTKKLIKGARVANKSGIVQRSVKLVIGRNTRNSVKKQQKKGYKRKSSRK